MKKYVKTYVFSGEHLEQLLLRAGFCLEPWHLIANLSSSAISEHKLWWSICEFFLEFQQNSKTATTIATAKPHNNTTNTPPMFFTLNGLAFESLLLSWNKNNDKMSLFYSRLFLFFWYTFKNFGHVQKFWVTMSHYHIYFILCVYIVFDQTLTIFTTFIV